MGLLPQIGTDVGALGRDPTKNGRPSGGRHSVK